MKNNVLSHFNNQGISLISYSLVDYDSDLRMLLSYIANRTLVITDSNNDLYSTNNKYVFNTINEKIFDTLKQKQDQSVFISVPIGEWIFPKKFELTPYENEKHFLEELHYISSTNNLSITLLSYTYNSGGPMYLNIKPKSIAYVSNFIISYKDKNIHVIKNRYGADSTKYDIREYKQLFNREYRERKLKRILKIT
jgi:hypothetical protein